MEKKRNMVGAGGLHPGLTKLIKIMKLTTFLFFLAITHVFAETSYAQATRLSLNMENAAVKDVLFEIEENSEFYFVYSNKLIDVERKVNVKLENKKVIQILDAVFEGEDVTYSVNDRQIILSPEGLNLNESGVAFQQSKTITGTVKSEAGEPLPGVTIVVKGTTNGTVSGGDGRFTLTVANNAETLIFSFVGMTTQEVPIGSQSVFDIVLVEETIGLEEVIAIGYGTVKKSDLTGAVGSLQGDRISERNTVQVSQALQGAMAGVMVTRNNNEPGSTASIRIRGITTIGDSNPLIIVDGVPADNINDINPNDIQDISVLKDAASAAIYGSRAAAGVILITTKRAKAGQLDLTYNAEYGFETITAEPEHADVIRYMQVDNEMRWNDNGNQGTEYATYPQDVVDNYWALNAENPNLYPNSDMWNTVIKDYAPRTSHNLSISAGAKSIRSKINIAYDKTEGLYEKRSYERFTARFNNDITINDFISASADIFWKRSVSNEPDTDPMRFALIHAPVYAIFWDDGRYASGKSGTNAYAQIKEGGFNDNWYNTIGGKASISITPLKGLDITGVVAPSFDFNKGKVFRKAVETTAWDDPTLVEGTLMHSTTSLNESRDDNYSITTQLLANYQNSFGNNNINVMAGYENYYAFYENLGASRGLYELTNYPYLDLGPLDLRDNDGSAYENAYRSFFGRILYNYNNKYYLQANFRYDGSSRFHQDYRWGAFPSFSAGWVMSEESFMSGMEKLSFLKLRASWGTLGNERIGNYPYQATIAFANALMYQGSDVVSLQTAAQTQYAIRDISWETTESYDFGIDASFFDNSLRFTGDYFIKTTKDMLLALEIPDFMGFDNPDQNTGTMETKGWELEVAYNNRAGDLGYSIAFNLSDFKSTMGDLGGTEFLGSQVKKEGSEFNEWYGYKSDGLFQTQEEVDNSAVTNNNVKPGDVKYVDISGPDGVPDGIISGEYDRVLLGGSLPRFMFGGNVKLDYKNIDFSVVLQGVGKQNTRVQTRWVEPLQENWGNVPAIIDGKYWSQYNTAEQNQNAEYPRVTWTSRGNNYSMSDYWLFNGYYLRVKNITLGYTLPSNWLNKISLKNVRIYASVNDLFSIDQHPKGWDPEVGPTSYPITSSFIFGVSVKF